MISVSIKNTVGYSGTALVLGGTQGGLYYDDKIYQFGNNGYCQVLDMNFNKLNSFRLPAYSDQGDGETNYPHCSSVEWVVPGQKLAVTTNDTGKVAYADRFYIYDISDTDNITEEVVMMNNCTDRSKYARMCCMAFDTTTKTMYVAGYTSGSSKSADSPCWFESYDFTNYITNGTLSADLIRQTESNGPGLHLQDGAFYNGYIYYLCDNSNTTNSSYDGLYIWVLNSNFETVTVVDILPGSPNEAETFALIPGEHCITLLSSLFLNGVTYYMTRVGLPIIEPALTLKTSVNVIGYTINGTLYGDSEIVLEEGNYTVVPVLRDGAVWNAWSDGDETLTRSFTASSESPATYSAYGVMETVYLVGSPAPITKATSGTSIYAQGTEQQTYFLVSTNTAYPNEYMLVSDGKQNDDDADIVTTNSSKINTDCIQYFDENHITEGMYYFTAIPKGYTKFIIKIHNGTGENNTPDSRNPNVIIVSGADLAHMKKIYGNTDVYRPIDSTIIETGKLFDISAIKVKSGTTGDYTSEIKDRSFVFVRLLGNSSRNNNSYAEIQFIKDSGYTLLTSVTQNGYSAFMTDYTPNENTELEYTIKYGADSLSYAWGGHFLSSADGTTTHTWYSPLFRTKGATDGSVEVFSMLGNGTEYTHTLSSYDISNPYKFEVKNGHIYVNGTAIMDATVGSGATLPLAMFSINNNGSLVTNESRMKNVTFYSAKISENGVVVRNYVPALNNETGKYGVLETLSNAFHEGNNGFIA